MHTIYRQPVYLLTEKLEFEKHTRIDRVFNERSPLVFDYKTWTLCVFSGNNSPKNHSALQFRRNIIVVAHLHLFETIKQILQIELHSAKFCLFHDVMHLVCAFIQNISNDDTLCVHKIEITELSQKRNREKCLWERMIH